METFPSYPSASRAGFFDRLFSWRTLRRLLITLIGIVTLAALFWTEENWRGRRAWQQYQTEWEAKGERFDLASFIPKAVPAEQNFALTPLLRPALDYASGSNGIQWLDTNGRVHLQNIQIDLAPAGSTNHLPAIGSLAKGNLTDLEAFRSFYHGNTNYPQPATAGTAAEDILVALGKFDADFNELHEAAASRPFSRFPIHYDEQPTFQILLPHLAPIKALCLASSLRAIAHLDLRQTDQALAALLTGFRLSDSVRTEPVFIDHLVRIATLNIGMQGVREGLVRHAWTDAQLIEIEKNLGSLDLLAEYKQAMRGERCMNIEGLDYYRRHGFPVGALYSDGDPAAKPPRSLTASFSFTPSGWFYHNMVAIAHLHQDFTLAAVDERKHRVFPETTEDMARTLARQRMTPYNIFAKLLMPAFAKAPMRTALAQTYVDEARVACALERYRLANGRLPETLTELVPGFIKQIPNDIIAGVPLRLRKVADGTYLLYSVGWNEIDDDGTVVLTKGSTPRIDATRGDWVWTYSAK